MSDQFFGQYLVDKNIIDQKQLRKAVGFQELENLKVPEFGIKKGYLDQANIDEIKKMQRTKGMRFGAAALALGILTQGQLDELKALQKGDHRYFGDVIVFMEFASEDIVTKALQDFRRELR